MPVKFSITGTLITEFYFFQLIAGIRNWNFSGNLHVIHFILLEKVQGDELLGYNVDVLQCTITYMFNLLTEGVSICEQQQYQQGNRVRHLSSTSPYTGLLAMIVRQGGRHILTSEIKERIIQAVRIFHPQIDVSELFRYLPCRDSVKIGENRDLLQL